MSIIPKFIDEGASIPSKAIGTTLDDVWNLTIGSHVSLWSKKQEARQRFNLQDYKDKIEEKTRSIPEGNLAEPPLHIVGPALEASKYYIDSKELRNMFANLVAASIDDRKIGKTHPSFVEIIKQLSPLDARVLENFKRRNQVALAQLKVVKEGGRYIVILEHIMNFNNKQKYKRYITSLSNLQRLGLLNISYSVHSADLNEYDFIKEHPSYEYAHQKLLEIQKTDPLYNEVDIQKGLCSTTPLCDDFIQICL